MQTFLIRNIKVHPFASSDQLISYADSHKGILVAVNAEKVVNAKQTLIDIINSNIGYCDGAGAVKVAHKKGIKNAVRIPGCELWLEIIARFYRTKKFYLIGSTEDVITRTVKKLETEFPGISIVGRRDGYIPSSDDEDRTIADVANKCPDIVFVAMGSPRQELFMQRLQQVNRAIYQGLGGSFDLYVGNFTRAPKCMQAVGCEWLWRFIAQPTRIRRITSYLKYAWLLYAGKL